ncbi:helix-turn-helix transcriptional regulator [Streptomyces sp. MC1]|nr:helix-turn-helix transcriptional regulator [Streptomyces sp. MC1]
MAQIPDDKSVALDAKGLRSLAHPVRVQLLGLLRTHGPATATQLPDRLGLNSGATSYHLRRLATAVAGGLRHERRRTAAHPRGGPGDARRDRFRPAR